MVFAGAASFLGIKHQVEVHTDEAHTDDFVHQLENDE